MSRLLPHPRLFLALVAMWLLLAGSVSPGQVLLGAVIAYVASWTLGVFHMAPVRLRRPSAMVRLGLRVLADIFRSNLAVGRIILAGHPREGHSGFITIPLDMRSEAGLALLAIIVTATPGTLWMNYDAAKGELLLHILDLVDEAHWPELIKNRYERLLMEIFE